MAKPKIKAILFDLDNTLIDFMRLKNIACQEAMSAMIDAGLEIDHDKAMRILFKLYDKYGIEYKMIFQEFLMETIGEIDWNILAHGIVAYRKIKISFLEPYPHVKSTLLKLKVNGYKVGIVSDAPRMRAWMRLATMKISDFFDFVVTFEDTGERKPSSLPFEAALKKLKSKPENVLMVGDWPERDIKGAKKLGIKTCFAEYGFHQKRRVKVSSDYQVNSIKELISILDIE